MPDSILGLPIHPLIVHAVIVFVPLAALGTLAIAAVPRWRGPYGWLVVAAATVSLICVPIATNSGQDLKTKLQPGGPVLEKINRHEDFGSKMIYVMAVLWAMGLALMWMHRTGRRGNAVTAVAVLAGIAAVGALVLITFIGHSGATAVWNPTG